MLQRIDQMTQEMENAKLELQIALNLVGLSMQEYIMIKRGAQDLPESVSLWALEEVNQRAEQLKHHLDRLNRLKKELFVF
ncbi:hypothetical protein BBW65_04820 [Helicobacter enhydrae]|uniref:DUF2443 domain-containing protein n=1 Tax=Helicobacter enhydrae TaxID=222136 RepID=A0A1B1U7L5_9HELI|nr:hypothetical protein BBW65_04820 [Helicobacter enhydrae]